MMHIHLKLCRMNSPTYVIEGDIKGRFDNINHNHIVDTLNEWQIPKWSLEIITKILKSNIFHDGQIYDSETGTPQGGVISPLLANVALTSLDNFCNNFGHRKLANPIVRYADDFIIVSRSEPYAEEVKDQIAEHLKETSGLTLSEEKTKITHITKGFNFLGFNFKKHKILKKGGKIEYALYIQPQREKTQDLLDECREIIKSNATATQENLIRLLIPKIMGWGMYYRFVNMRNEQNRFDRLIWNNLRNWGNRRHPKKSKRWIRKKYFRNKPNTKSWYFGDPNTNLFLPRLGEIPKKRFVKVDKQYRVYDSKPETIEYWRRREYVNAYNQIKSIRRTRLFKKQNGKCYHCQGNFVQDDIYDKQIHTHHLIPKAKGGTEDYSNLRLVHIDCHWELHALATE